MGREKLCKVTVTSDVFSQICISFEHAQQKNVVCLQTTTFRGVVPFFNVYLKVFLTLYTVRSTLVISNTDISKYPQI